MGGNFLDGAVALLYFLMFQLCGVTLAACFLNKERRYTQMILGSAAGSVLLMWLPSLWAFLFSFSITAHVLALISLPCRTHTAFAARLVAAVRVFGAAQLPLPKRRDLVEPMHLRRHEHALRVHHEYRGAEDISAHVFHFTGRETFVSVLVG